MIFMMYCPYVGRAIDGREAEKLGLVLKSFTSEDEMRYIY
jgi:hypothetical protein